jgi:hypothetical protein
MPTITAMTTTTMIRNRKAASSEPSGLRKEAS